LALHLPTVTVSSEHSAAKKLTVVKQ
jgi:hypothetical protein